jgi:hypothetical protein
MRSRRRWIDNPKLSDTIEQRAANHLQAIGIGPDQLQNLAGGGLIEVSIDYSSSTSQTSDQGWEARLLPWEYLLAVATKRFRNDDPFVVVRSIPIPLQSLSNNKNGLFIQSAPGRLRGQYNFDIECAVLDKHIGDQISLRAVDNPTRDLIAHGAASEVPSVVHLSGIDSFQGTRLLDPEQRKSVSDIRDGVYLRDESWNEQVVDSFSLAQAITAATLKPALVSFNCYNSSARTAAFSASLGAGAAIGFQDFVDDMLAEVFFANYYLHWSNCQCDPLLVFRRAMESLGEYDERMRGTGIVFWSSKRLTPVSSDFYSHVESPLNVSSQGIPPLRDWVRTEIEPREKLNYSILHNERRPLFEDFSIYRLEPRPLQDLEVQVELQIGGEHFPYRRAISLPDHVVDLADQVGVGLTSRLARSLQEAVRTTLMVRVFKEHEQLVSETFQVSLLPVNEWRDDDLSRKWLPSFVLPRDPAVLRIIIAAQRYLMAFEDDANAGFDGYQSVDLNSEDPTENVDAQVRAIWSALLHDFKLNYINPPPTFTTQSQRLRTPSSVTEGQRGTCIDLSLLISACLEYIGIDPVIFLLNGHAFPGYWSSDQRRGDVLAIEPPLMETASTATPVPDEKEEEEETSSYAQNVPWVFDRSRFDEVIECVQRGVIVPLESTLLTSRGGFWEAIEEGMRNLDDPEQFHSMLDVKLARDSDVTPLPLAEFDGD